MKEFRPIPRRSIYGAAIFYIAVAFVASSAQSLAVLPAALQTGSGLELAISIIAGNQIAILHWQRLASDPNHRYPLTLKLIVHQAGVYVAAFTVVHLIFRMT
ncbi:hypothetical protein ACFVTJ_06795 [Agrobacterium sp. NPDC058088]|uniref:hypothetical protein n=1 Tax=Agrobacterium sp. NPDC058088 TaxID=3346335 RepID=UPI0036D822BA